MRSNRSRTGPLLALLLMGGLLALPSAQACIGCAGPMFPAAADCSGPCTPSASVVQGLSRAFRFPSVIDAEELCLGNYPGYVFPADIVISGGVVAKALRDSSSHFAFGFSSGGPC